MTRSCLEIELKQIHYTKKMKQAELSYFQPQLLSGLDKKCQAISDYFGFLDKITDFLTQRKIHTIRSSVEHHMGVH